MNHDDHVALIRAGVEDRPGRWADLGSGRGAFTLALADVLGADGSIISVDRDAGVLDDQRREMESRFPHAAVDYRVGDFTRPMELPPLDGIVMANSLHFVRDKAAVLAAIVEHLPPGGRFVLVEYDADHGNPWVPYPLSFTSWRGFAPTVSLSLPRLLGRVPSRFLNAIYAAASEANRPKDPA